MGTADMAPSAAEDIRQPLLGGAGDPESGGVQVANVNTGANRRMTLFPLVAMVFFNVSGGPYGNEDGVSAAGPLLCLVGYVIYPWLWALPNSLITVEMATMFPSNGGYSLWVKSAFGDFWGFQEGFCQWIAGQADTALYPALIVDYIAQLGFTKNLIHELTTVQRYAVKETMVFIGTALNIMGVDILGKCLVALGVFVLSPFVFLGGYALFSGFHPGNLLKGPPLSDIQWIPFSNSLYWNLSGWANVSAFAGEVHNPNKTFPPAMFIAIAMVIGCNALPILILSMTEVGGDYTKWHSGFYNELSFKLGGEWLSIYMVVASIVTGGSMFIAEMCQDSYQMYGMAEIGMLPKFLTKRLPNQGAPIYTVLASWAVISLLVAYDFQTILQIDNLFTCLGMILQNLAFIRLRFKLPTGKRTGTYTAPLKGRIGGLLMGVPPCLVGIMTIVLVDTIILIFAGSTVVCGCLVYVSLLLLKKSGWVDFVTFVEPECDLADAYAAAIAAQADTVASEGVKSRPASLARRASLGEARPANAPAAERPTSLHVHSVGPDK